MKLKFRFRTEANDSAYLCDNCKYYRLISRLEKKEECTAPKRTVKLDIFPCCSGYSSTIKKIG